MKAKNVKEVKIKDITLGGNNPVLIQSMCNTKTKNITSTNKQIKELENAGCDLIRVAVPDIETAQILPKIKKDMKVPLIGDIHFDYRIAIEASKHCDKIRINPGNIGRWEHVCSVIENAKKNDCAIRIGVNMGSLSKECEKEMGRTPKAMVKSALEYINFFEKNNFKKIVVSLKSSDVLTSIYANRMFREKSSYPLHIGITEAGTKEEGAIKSSIGIGTLLADGIGETIRVSLTADPTEEIPVAKSILKFLNRGNFGRTIISCPTCARTHGKLIDIAKEVEKKTKHINKPLKIAIMGCEVNGPGEAKDADFGVALGKDSAYLFKNGEVTKKVMFEQITKELLKEINTGENVS
ncbi:MAG: flavodoxin-dependent (E)-4-hydroxy-3-methylbut-2-enyl-diphosphate synthase [Candidatus Nanoarchaeia archaeon]